MMTLRKLAFGFCLCWLVVMAGCRSTSVATNSIADEPVPSLVDSVDVSGFVGKPQKVDIDSNGLSLRQALVRAGGIQRTKAIPGSVIGSTEVSLDHPFVHLQRRSSIVEVQNFYFALPFVTQGIAGSIPLRNGDWIEIVEAKTTSIGANSINSDGTSPKNKTFFITGAVPNPGKYTTKSTSEKLFEAMNYGGSFKLKEVALIRSATAGTGVETFFIPINQYASLLRTIRIRENDIIAVKEVNASPIALTALIEPVLKARSIIADQTNLGSPARFESLRQRLPQITTRN